MLKLPLLPALIAALNPLDPENLAPTEPSRIFGMNVRDIFLVVGLALVLGCILFLWVYLTRQKRRSNHQGLSRAIYRAEKDSEVRSGGTRHRRKRRRRDHPENLPRNPTLAEAGGLPPMRTDEPREPRQPAS